MKKGRLSAFERQYILDHKHISTKKLSKELDRSESVIQQVLDSYQPTGIPKENNDFKIMKRHKNAVIFTEVGGSVGDEVIKQASKELDPLIVYKPFGDRKK